MRARARERERDGGREEDGQALVDRTGGSVMWRSEIGRTVLIL